MLQALKFTRHLDWEIIKKSSACSFEIAGLIHAILINIQYYVLYLTYVSIIQCFFRDFSSLQHTIRFLNSRV